MSRFDDWLRPGQGGKPAAKDSDISRQRKHLGWKSSRTQPYYAQGLKTLVLKTCCRWKHFSVLFSTERLSWLVLASVPSAAAFRFLEPLPFVRARNFCRTVLRQLIHDMTTWIQAQRRLAQQAMRLRGKDFGAAKLLSSIGPVLQTQLLTQAAVQGLCHAVHKFERLWDRRFPFPEPAQAIRLRAPPGYPHSPRSREFALEKSRPDPSEVCFLYLFLP